MSFAAKSRVRRRSLRVTRRVNQSASTPHSPPYAPCSLFVIPVIPPLPILLCSSRQSAMSNKHLFALTPSRFIVTDPSLCRPQARPCPGHLHPPLRRHRPPHSRRLSHALHPSPLRFICPTQGDISVIITIWSQDRSKRCLWSNGHGLRRYPESHAEHLGREGEIDSNSCLQSHNCSRMLHSDSSNFQSTSSSPLNFNQLCIKRHSRH